MRVLTNTLEPGTLVDYVSITMCKLLFACKTHHKNMVCFQLIISCEASFLDMSEGPC